MNKQLKLLIIPMIFCSYLEAATQYIVGQEIGDTRRDRIVIGSSGGFHGFTNPTADITKLYIALEPSNDFVEANTIPAFSDYTMPYISSSVTDLYILGDATYWATLVLGNSGFGGYGVSIHSPAAYGLPTPAAGTIIHFMLSHAPLTEPELWFQRDLPAGCIVIFEPGYQNLNVGNLEALDSRRDGEDYTNDEYNVAVGIINNTSAGAEIDYLNKLTEIFSDERSKAILVKAGNIFKWKIMLYHLAIDPKNPETDPKRLGSEFTSKEYGAGVVITQIRNCNTSDGYLGALKEVFSDERAQAILDKIVEGDFEEATTTLTEPSALSNQLEDHD